MQQTNCHPFRHGRWLWMHNGLIIGFDRCKRDLALAVDPSLFPDIEGTTDSEVFFHLALTYGLEDEPVARWRARSASSRRPGAGTGVEHPIQMTVATTDGDSVWAFRYSSEDGRARSSTAPTSTRCARSTRTWRILDEVSDDARLVVSEPLGTSRARGTRCRNRPTA